jgi:hypothetical protein
MSGKWYGKSSLHKVGTLYAKHAGKMARFNYMEIFLKCTNTFKKSHAHLQCVYNKCARFEECQPKGVGGVHYTK